MADPLLNPDLQTLLTQGGGGTVVGFLAALGASQIRRRFTQADKDKAEGITRQVNDLHTLLMREDPKTGVILGDPRTIRRDHRAIRDAIEELSGTLRALIVALGRDQK